MNSIYTYPLDIHGLISGNNGESDLVTNIAALSVVKLSWERSRLLVVFLGVSESFQKLSQIIDAPFECDSIVFSRVSGFEKRPDVFFGIRNLLANRELLDLSESGSEFSIFLRNSLGVLAFVFVSSSWADLEKS